MKYNFVAPSSFTDCYSSGLIQKLGSSSNSGLEQKLPKWNFIESSSLRYDLTFFMSGFGYSSNSGLKEKRPKWNPIESSTRGSTKHFASKSLLKVKLYWFSLGHSNQTISKLSSWSLCVLVLEHVCTLKSLIKGFHSLFRFDRNRSGGGIMLYVREDIPAKLLSHNFPSAESFFIKINLYKNK